MAHRSRDRNFGYPPVPSVYTNSVSTFGGLQGTAPMGDREPETSRSPYYGHDATTYSTPSPYASSYQDNVDENAPTQNAPVIPPALSSDYSHLAPHKSVETKGAGFHAHNNNKNTDAKSVTEIQRNQRDEKDQDAGHNGSFESISTTNVMVRSQGSSKANSTSKSAFHQWPQGTQPYVPRGPDTSEDHANFGCDLCPVIVARRDILQIHKAQFHGMTESPFVPESGSVDMPPYLKGVTLESCSKHSRHALRIFNGGALSSSPCQPCKSRGLDCIVNPFLSSLCVRCSYYDNGSYCGAAGVKYRKPRGVVDDPRVTTTSSKSYTQPMEQRSKQTAPKAPQPGVSSHAKETQHSSGALMGHNVSTNPGPRNHTFSTQFNEGREGWAHDGRNDK